MATEFYRGRTLILSPCRKPKNRRFASVTNSDTRIRTFFITHRYRLCCVFDGADGLARIRTFFITHRYRGPFVASPNSVARLLEVQLRTKVPHNPNYEEMAPLLLMTVLRQHGRSYGSKKTLVVSSHHTLLRDSKDQIDHYARGKPSPQGLTVANPTDQLSGT